MFISNITEAEVTETIMDLNNSSPGYDEVPAIVMKQNIHALIKPLTYLINCSINKGIFPDELKIAKVIPIYISLVIKPVLKIIDPFLFCQYFPKFLRR